MSLRGAEVAIVGAGFSGATVARQLAERDFKVVVFDARSHVAGNCHTEFDSELAIYRHAYGPHIFHTRNKEVWDFVNLYADFEPYIHRVKANHKGQTFSLPVNLHTLNQFVGRAMSPEEAREWVGKQAITFEEPSNFEDQALAMMGSGLYEAFFKGYTTKQWGREPRELPASVLKRLPMRFNFDDNYFDHPYQGLPRTGYTALVEAILDHGNIEVVLNHEFEPRDAASFRHTFWSGPLDAFFGFDEGYLRYRTLHFEFEKVSGDFQGCAQMNFVDVEVPYTRVTQHNYLNLGSSNNTSLISREFSREWTPGEIPYYPIRLAEDNELVETYITRADDICDVTFLGRLGTYRYLDMDVTIQEALNVATDFLSKSL